jgi:putative aldouronate transport system substrate-binding protein
VKKLLCVLLVFAMIFAIGACAKQAQEQPSGDNETGTKPPEEDEGEVLQINEYGWEVPKETITITYFAGFGDQAEEDERIKPMADFYKEKFNVVINKVLYQIDMNEKLNLMLASGDYPEVIAQMTDEMAEKFIDQGKALEITPYVEKYGPNILKGMGDYINLLKTDEGKLYKLASAWGFTSDILGKDFSVRYDMWKKSGLPMYTNMEEFYEIVKKLVEQNPTNANGEKVYAISTNDQGAALYNTPLGAYGFKDGYKVDESTNEFTHWINTEEGLEIAKYINRFYRENLIDPDFINNKWDDWVAKVTSERIIANIGTWWHMYVAGHESWIPAEGEKYDSEKRFVNVSIKQPGVDKHTLLRDDFLRDGRTIITDKCTQPENIVKWWNWEVTEKGAIITGYGVPGPDNVYDFVDDKVIFTDASFYSSNINEDYHKPKDASGSFAYWMVAPAYTPLNTKYPEMMDERVKPHHFCLWGWELNYDKVEISKFDANKQLDLELKNKYYEPEAWDATLLKVVFPPEAPISIINQNIKDNLLSEWAKIITADTEDQCRANFIAAREKLNELGLQELEQYNQESYQKNLRKFNGEFDN